MSADNRDSATLMRRARAAAVILLGCGLAVDLFLPINIHLPILYIAAVAISALTVSTSFLLSITIAAMLASVAGLLGPAALGDAPMWVHIGNRVLVIVTIGIVAGLVSMMMGILRELRDREGELQMRNGQIERLLAERSSALDSEAAERRSAEAKLQEMKRLENTGRAALDKSDELVAMLDLSIGNLQILGGRLDGQKAAEFKSYTDRALAASERAAAIVRDWHSKARKTLN